MNKLVKKIINLVAIGIIVVALLVGNIVCGTYSQAITEYLHGSGVSFSGEELEEVLNTGDALVSEIEGEGVIMLKNTMGKAPLKDVNKVNLFGWGSSDAGWCISGYGSGELRIDPERTDRLQESLVLAGIEYNPELSNFYKNFRAERTPGSTLGSGIYKMVVHEPMADVYTTVKGEGGRTLLENAKAYSNTAIIVITRFCGEGVDVPRSQQLDTAGTWPDGVHYDNNRTYLEITEEQEKMINLVKDNFENVIVLVNTTNGMEIGWIDDAKIDAAYWVGAPGQSGTRAVPKILKGDINPSGRTTFTWPYDLKTDPAYVNSGSNYNGTVTYQEGIYVGYRWYETADAEGFWDSEYAKTKWGIENGYEDVVQYPFGYGLSYTDFEWEFSTPDGSPAILPEPGSAFVKTDTISVTVRVTNKGTVAGKDVVQLYCKPPYKENGIEKSSINLVAFAKTQELQPGQSQYLTLTFTPYEMASYDCYDRNHNRYSGYELDKGIYEICLAKNVHEVVKSFKYEIDYSIKYKNDPVTGTPVKNQFTGATAYAGAPIDGSGANPQLVYLTRNDFENTFPATRFKAIKYNQDEVDSYITDKSDTTVTHTFGANADLRMFVKNSGAFMSKSELKAPKDYKRNEELMLELGNPDNLQSEKWDTFLNQLTINEMVELIMRGGYQTTQIESIGKIWMRENDGPMGLTRGNATSTEKAGWNWYPMVGVLSASWNERLAYRFGGVVAAEAHHTGVMGWYAPGCNLVRSAWGGRNNEYYGEDGLFSGKICAQTVLGSLNNGLPCYVKHFAVNETETGRVGLYTYLTEQALRETYLKPFEIAVKEGKANSIMSSFNRLGNIWTGGTHALCTTILRDEWGFRGAVVTDYYGMDHQVALMKPTQGVLAGNDLWLTGNGNAVEDFDRNDPTTLNAMRNACKNIVYKICNTFWLQTNHDPADDELVVDIGVVDIDRPFPWWITWLTAIDVLVVGGCGVWTYFVLRKKKEANVVKATESDDAQPVANAPEQVVSAPAQTVAQAPAKEVAPAQTVAKTPKKAPAPVPAPKAVQEKWNCPTCGTVGIKSKFCPECGTKKPEPAQTWDCACGEKGITSKFCPECGAKRP